MLKSPAENLADSIFEMGCAMNRVAAIALAPEPSLHEFTIAQEKERDDRFDMLNAARDTEITDLAHGYLETTDRDTAHRLCDWFMDKLWDMPPVERLRLIQQCPALVPKLSQAAHDMATEDWDTRYPR